MSGYGSPSSGGLPPPVTHSRSSSSAALGPLATQQLAQFRDFLGSVPAGARQYCTQLWNRLRPVINDLENQVSAATAQQSPSSRRSSGAMPPPPASPSRPTTSDSVQAIRMACDEVLDMTADALDPPSSDLFSLSARDAYLLLQKMDTVESETNCWLSTNAPSGTHGYVKFNLRNSSYYSMSGSGRLLNLGNEYAHRLAIIAKSDYERLKLATYHGQYQVSHLCHNPRCFNPDHVYVEANADNNARKGCNGAYVIEKRCECGRASRWDPCSHERMSIGKRCILPTRIIPSGSGYWENRMGEGPMLRERR